MARRKKFKIKNTFTFVLAVIIIIIAVALYIYKYKQNDFIDDSNSTPTQIQAGNNVTGVMKIHFIDVGQADSIFVELPDGNNILIDAGESGDGDTVTSYINTLGYDTIDILIATHTDADHIGGMRDIFENFKVNYCYRPSVYYKGEKIDSFTGSFNQKPTGTGYYACTTATYYNFLKCVKDEKCGWEYFTATSDFYGNFKLNDVDYSYEMDFLTPTKQPPYVIYKDSNDYSPISVLSYGDFDLLLTGDAHMLVENEVLQNYNNENFKDIEVLKVGHHGSESSTSNDFVRAFSPEYAVISCGNHKTFLHPRQVTLNTLFNNGINVFRTDLQGNIVLTVQSDYHYGFATQKQVLDVEDLYVGKDVTGVN